MTTDFEKLLFKARENENTLGWRLHGLALKSDERSRVACACFAIAQQHYAAIIILLSQKPQPMASSACSLLRPLTEAACRGLWVAKCATDEKIANLRTAEKKQIDTKSIFDDLKRMNAPSSEKDPSLYRQDWPKLSAFVHTYESALEPWLATPDTEQNFSADDLSEILKKIDFLAEMIESGVMSLRECSANSR